MKTLRNVLGSICIAVACSSSLAAGSVGLQTYLSSLPRVAGLIQVDINAYVFTYKQQTGSPLTLGLNASSDQSARSVNEIALYIPKAELTRTEAGLLNEAALSLVLKCFNIRPDRKPAIASFMAVQNADGWTARTAYFGPLEVQYERRSIFDRTSTVILLRRSGMPGQSPWVNFCTL